MTLSDNWWGKLYDDLLADLLLENRSAHEENQTVAFLQDKLNLSAGARVMDQCCGTGNISLPLAKMGYDVIGIDQAQNYIQRAQQKCVDNGCSGEFVTADAFTFVSRPTCDAVFNWWTSFGHSLDDALNQRMLDCAYASLRADGKMALDTLNLPGVIKHFKPEMLTRKITEAGEVILIRESAFDFSLGALNKHWTYFLPNGERVQHQSSVRLYMPHVIKEMMLRSGFIEVALFGDIDGSPLTENSLRCILVGKKFNDTVM